MIHDIRSGARALIISAACSLFAMSALAEPAATTAPAAAPAAKAAPAAAPAAKQAAPAVTTAAPAAAKSAAAPAKAAKKVATSPCQGLDENSCKGKGAACAWIVPKDPNDKTGKVQPAYCRKVAGVAAKKPVAPKAAAAKAAAPQVTTTTAAPAKAAAPQVTTTTGATAAKAPAPAAAQ